MEGPWRVEPPRVFFIRVFLLELDLLNITQSRSLPGSMIPSKDVNSMQSNAADSVKENSVKENVKEYYGKVLQSSNDLKTSACCPIDSMPQHLKPLLANIEPEVQERFYGCGSPLPFALEGCTVLDLGCGTGRDVYLASQLVGPNGKVIGVDMTQEQISVAKKYTKSHMDKFGYAESNVEFHHGTIEDLKSLGIADQSVDVVISNCVINLSPAKQKVFAEILRVLKPGGELYFSDVFADRRIPVELMQDEVLLGECLSGAMYFEDFRRMMHSLGVADVREVSSSVLTIEDSEIQQKVGATRFFSNTVRAFKLDSIEDRCEDYGQFVAYQGGISECPVAFVLDDHHVFELAKPMAVCGNTAAMLEETRFAKFFKVHGNRSNHFGLFDCTEGGSAETSVDCC